jgi:hypothetical protein
MSKESTASKLNSESRQDKAPHVRYLKYLPTSFPTFLLLRSIVYKKTFQINLNDSQKYIINIVFFVFPDWAIAEPAAVVREGAIHNRIHPEA